ncbi:MAG: 4'-phosphopantetheinyl transferase superfamily protein [Cloacibacterium sp.]|nr:4'-phosphopantetheinyl transferase superfamily protein [Cloacibacterium sp.]
MPLFRDFSDNQATIQIWKFDENEVLDSQELLEPENLEKIKDYHPKKLSEHLMIRRILKNNLPKHKILYQGNGEPYLSPHTHHISISHSFPYAVLAISEKKIGIDIEKIQPKISKLKHKFLYKTELEWTKNDRETEYLSAIWAIKESLYKIHPSKYWSLKKHYEVFPFDLDKLDSIECRIFDEVFNDYFTAQVRKVEDYYFAVVYDV